MLSYGSVSKYSTGGTGDDGKQRGDRDSIGERSACSSPGFSPDPSPEQEPIESLVQRELRFTASWSEEMARVTVDLQGGLPARTSASVWVKQATHARGGRGVSA